MAMTMKNKAWERTELGNDLSVSIQEGSEHLQQLIHSLSSLVMMMQHASELGHTVVAVGLLNML